jgi:hypothetical protein
VGMAREAGGSATEGVGDGLDDAGAERLTAGWG